MWIVDLRGYDYEESFFVIKHLAVQRLPRLRLDQLEGALVQLEDELLPVAPHPGHLPSLPLLARQVHDAPAHGGQIPLVSFVTPQCEGYE